MPIHQLNVSMRSFTRDHRDMEFFRGWIMITKMIIIIMYFSTSLFFFNYEYPINEHKSIEKKPIITIFLFTWPQNIGT